MFGLPRTGQIARHHHVADGGNSGQDCEWSMTRFAQAERAVHARPIKCQLQRVGTLPIQAGGRNGQLHIGEGCASARCRVQVQGGRSSGECLIRCTESAVASCTSMSGILGERALCD